MILDQAYRYIIELQKQNDAMLLKGGDLVQGEMRVCDIYRYVLTVQKYLIPLSVFLCVCLHLTVFVCTCLNV